MVRAQPKRAIAGLTYRIDLVVYHAARSEAAQTCTIHAEKTCGSAGQDSAVAPLAQAKERDVVEMRRLVHAFEPGAPANIEPAIRRGPDLSVSIFQNRRDEFVAQTFARAEGAKTAVLMMQ